jgi:hypothetical protein
LEAGIGAEDGGVGLEGDHGAAAVLGGADLLELACGFAAGVALAVNLAVAGDLDRHAVGERVDHREADTMQAARGGVDLLGELGARMQRDHDDLERRLALELGVGVDRDAAAVVGYGDLIVGAELDLDAGRVAGHRLVHGVVQQFARQMVHGALVAAADVHAGASAHRLEAFQDLDVLGRVTAGGLCPGVEKIGHAA